MDEFVIGIENTVKIIVTPEMLAPNFAPGTPEAFATPALVALIERTAAELINRVAGPEDASVGTIMDLSHTAPTPLGMSVQCKVVLEKVEGRQLLFHATAWDEAGPIGEAHHERFIVNKERFNKKILNRKEEKS